MRADRPAHLAAHPVGIQNSDFDIQSLRAATPGTRHARHLNAAGAALASETVLRSVIEHLRLESRIGGYEAAAAAAERSEAVYASAARLIGAQPDDVALVESATVGWHRAIDALPLPPGSRILASASSYVSSALHLVELRRSRGVTFEVLPVDASGGTDLDALAKALRTPAALVTVAHVPTSSGLVEPVSAIGALTAAAGVPLLLDATQSLGQLPLDVGGDGVDIAVATGRKFLRGPRGTGLLYVSPAMRRVMRSPHPDVRGARWHAGDRVDVTAGARRYETWEAAHALRLGLGTALDEALRLGIARINAHVTGLAGRLREALAGIAGVRVADPPAARSGIVTFVRDGEDPQQTALALRAAGLHLVSVPAGHGQWDLGRRGLPAVVRASVHVYNDDSDIAALAGALERRRGAARTAPALVRAGRRADVVVVGAGVHGSAAAWQLAGRGLAVTHLDRFPEGHTEGSSHGHTRMIRRAYPSASWDALVQRAYESWAQLSEASGTKLVTTVGGLFAHAGDAAGLRGPGCRSVGADEAARLFAGLRLGPGWSAVHDPDAGIIDAAAALRRLRELAVAAGVERRASCGVRSWRADGDGVRVLTDDGEIGADRLVVCAGAWTPALVPQFAGLLSVVRIVNVFLGASDPRRVSPPQLGPFSVQVPGTGLLYGIPAFDGSGLKVGLDPDVGTDVGTGPADDPERPQRPPEGPEVARLVELARRFVPGADGPVLDTVACRYTMAPRNRFAIGELPGHPQVLVAAACSGHGFKFGPAIGAALADLATGVARPDLAAFSPAALGVAA